jgi:lipid-binding SYLF domain-containing protein
MKSAVLCFMCIGLMMVMCGCQTQSSDINLPKRPTKTQLRQAASICLKDLYVTMPFSKTLAPKAKAIVIFPRIYKAGLMYGGQSGDGVSLSSNGTPLGYYNISAVSYGLQIGVQGFSYAMFLMSDAAVEYMNKSGGWEVGAGPSVVLVDEGLAKTMTTTTIQSDVYSFVFNQKGLMAGLGLQGSKITTINPAP